MRKKILTTFLIVFCMFIVFNLNEVFGVGIVSQAWTNDVNNDGKTDLIFRTYTTPHWTTVRDYHNLNKNDYISVTKENGTNYKYLNSWNEQGDGKYYTSKWVDTSGSTGFDKPSATTFRTLGFAFHTKPIGQYTSIASDEIGDRLSETIGYNNPGGNIGQWVDSIDTAYTNSSIVYARPKVSNSYDDVVFYELFRGTGTYTAINWGTGTKIPDVTNNKSTQLRYCIVCIGGINVYVADNVVYGDDRVALIKAANTAKAGLKFYVSDIVISKTLHSTGGYEVSETAEEFYYAQHNKQKIGWYDDDGSWVQDWYWSKSSRGRANDSNKAMGSVANLYDNQLEVPQTSTRTVLVRHINIGMNTTIDTSIIKTALKGGQISPDKTYFYGTNPVGETNPFGQVNDNASTTYDGYIEYYKDKVYIDSEVKKEANADKNTYRYIGHNIAVSTDLGTAQSTIDTQIKNGKFNTGRTAKAAAKAVTSDSDYVVIDFYYTEYEKDVYVNHLFVTEDGVVKDINKQNIVPNKTAIMNSSSINRINTDAYISEVYEKKMGYNVYTRKADSVTLSDNFKYWGYETSTKKTDASSLVGKKLLKTNLGTAQTNIPLTSSDIQVNLYYHKTTDVEVLEPEKDIGGRVFTIGKDLNMMVSCRDNKQSTDIYSVPSGTEAIVGIEGIPRYMVGAITTDYSSLAEAERTMDLSLTFKMGNETKTIDFDTIKYQVGYYKVTDMVVYKLKNMTIYDAGNDHTGTAGPSLFNWTDGILNITPSNMDLGVQLTGIGGNTIDNTPEAINNINNYVAVSIEDKYGKKSDKGSANSNLSRTYLTVSQLESVDANGDKKVTDSDKTYAANKLQEYNTILTNKKGTEKTKQTAYENAVKTRNDLKSKWDKAIEERDRLYGVYQKLEVEKTDRLKNIGKAETDIKTLKEITLISLNKELGSLVTIESQSLTAKNTAEKNLEFADQEKNRLNQVYLDNLKLREELAAKANCRDTVDEDIYIYLEQEEKDALEQCRLDKEAYNKNLEDKIVEKALEEYNDYYENEWNVANNKVTTATSNYDTAVKNRKNKEDEITSTNTTITQKEGALKILQNDYISFINNKYTPAKNSYEKYRDEIVPAAEKAYSDNVSSKSVENAYEVLVKAQGETKKAQEAYDAYKKYKNDLDKNFASYKGAYEEFVALKNATTSEAAKLLGLKLNLFVQNMTVKINGQTLTKADNNTAQKTYSIQELVDGLVPELRTTRPVISKEVYSNIGSTLMSYGDFARSYSIDQTKLNGVSVLAGKAVYETEVIVGGKSASEIEDTIYYSDQSNDEKRVLFKLKNQEITKTYRINNKATNAEEKYKETQPINIYTPITVSAELTSDTNQIINQTKNDNMTNSVIQINTPFTIKLSNDPKPAGYNISNTNRFSKGYYVKFFFDVHKVTVNGKLYNNGNKIAAGTWIGFIEDVGNNTNITAQAYGNLENTNLDVVNEENSYYLVRAVAYNATEAMRERSIKYYSLVDLIAETSDLKDTVENICSNPSYFTEDLYNVVIVNRAYDFRVTDVKDVNWKSVFRTNTSSNTNAHKSIVYHSGTTKWNTKSEQSNEIVHRTSSEIGRNPLRILPIGPYKNTTTTYVNAPKIGYRFSFDMKVTGSYYEVVSNTELKPKENKKVEIGTKFYYISKDGKTYLPEYTEGKEGIYLFYKTSSGKYVRIDENGGGYNLSFTPNDGYRYIEDDNISTLSKTSVSLGNLRKITLNHNMATVSNNGSIITYYGEYKLPNSTIAVKVNADGTYDINSPLKNGYIGVIFDIVAYSGKAKIGGSEQDVLLSYSKDTKNKANTSQWDYEGFLGYTNFGEPVPSNNPIKLKLEKGTWSINNEIYNKVKGSVMLYDLDARAATDYE